MKVNLVINHKEITNRSENHIKHQHQIGFLMVAYKWNNLMSQLRERKMKKFERNLVNQLWFFGTCSLVSTWLKMKK
jgi:hypothetical protein